MCGWGGPPGASGTHAGQGQIHKERSPEKVILHHPSSTGPRGTKGQSSRDGSSHLLGGLPLEGRRRGLQRAANPQGTTGLCSLRDPGGSWKSSFPELELPGSKKMG